MLRDLCSRRSGLVGREKLSLCIRRVHAFQLLHLSVPGLRRVSLRPAIPGKQKEPFDYMILQRCSVFRYLNTLFVRTAVSGFSRHGGGHAPVSWPDSRVFPSTPSFPMSWKRSAASSCRSWKLSPRRKTGLRTSDFYTLLIGISGVLGRSGPDRLRMGGQHVCDLHFPILFLYAMDYAAPTFTCIRFQGKCLPCITMKRGSRRCFIRW